MKHLIVTLILISQSALAITIKPHSGREIAASAEEVKVILDIASCVSTGITPNGVRACAKPFMALELSQSDQDLLIEWFRLSHELTYPKTCDQDDTKFAPKEYKAKAKTFLCSSYMRGKLKTKVVFMLVEKSGSMRLYNIKESVF